MGEYGAETDIVVLVIGDLLSEEPTIPFEFAQGFTLALSPSVSIFAPPNSFISDNITAKAGIF